MKRAIIIVSLFIASFSVLAGVSEYLNNYRKEYKKDPRSANLQWFKDARFGMFIHYGLYRRLGSGE